VTQQGQGAGGADPQHEGGPTGPVVRDKRKVDPQTGQVRETVAEAQASQQSDAQAETPPEAAHPEASQPEGSQSEGPQAEAGEPGQAAPEGEAGDTAYPEQGEEHPDTLVAAERLEDLRRLQAEYVNYRRRVDRDRARDKEVAVGGVVEALLPVLDDIHSAREHGDLTDGPFAAIADKLAATLGRFGVEQFGAPGETFDPALHEALMHLPGADLPEGATETTVVQVMQPGFKVGDRVVRPARVSVADPA
jgi:molecular chaperone GrpE